MKSLSGAFQMTCHLRVWVLTLLLTCVSIATAEYVSETVDVAIAQKGQLVGAKNIEDIPKIDVITCISRCKQSYECKSINYRFKGSRRCSLKSGTQSESRHRLNAQSDYLHYEIRKFIGLTNRTRLSKKELKERRASPMNSCLNNQCIHNSTCVETSGKVNYMCRCKASNSNTFCKEWKDSFSDFDLLFPTINHKEFVSQRRNEAKDPNTHYQVSFWLYPDSLSKNSESTAVSLVDEGKAKLTVILKSSGETSNLEVHFGTVKLKKLGKTFSLKNRQWSFVSIKWHSTYKHKKKKHIETREVKIESGGHKPEQTDYETVNQPLSFKDPRVLVGQRADFNSVYSFKGRISQLNIKNTIKKFTEIAWPTFWNFYGPNKTTGVVKLPYSEVKKVWEIVPSSSINYTVNGKGIEVKNATQETNGYLINANLIHSCDSVSYLSVVLKSAQSKPPKKVKYKVRFFGKVLCYGIFGWTLNVAGVLQDTGVYPFDQNKDLIETSNLRTNPGYNEFRSPLTGCGEDHFFYQNDDKDRHATVTQRIVPNAKQLILRVFFKCGLGNFDIKHFQFMF